MGGAGDGVNPDSALFRAHPEWALQVAGRPLVTARNQLVLDLGRDDVRDHLFAMLDTLLRTLPIAYLKWDHNRDLAPAGGADGRAGYHAQVAGAYALIDRLRAAHPAVEIEACAGGGGRSDAGIATRTHRFWTSDCIDAVSRVEMQRGFLAFLPPEMMGAHVGASPAHSTGRSQSMAFRAAVALPGHFGVELDPATIDAADAEILRDGIARYKALRDRLHGSAVWLGDGPDGIVWQLHGRPGAMLLFVTRIEPTGLRHPPAIALPPLAGAGAVRVRLLHIATVAGHAPPDAALFAGDAPGGRGAGRRLAGAGRAAAAGDESGKLRDLRAGGGMIFDPTEHPHRRQNLLTGEWLLVSPHRAKRPWQGDQAAPTPRATARHDPNCHLCPGNPRANGERQSGLRHALRLRQRLRRADGGRPRAGLHRSAVRRRPRAR